MQRYEQGRRQKTGSRRGWPWLAGCLLAGAAVAGVAIGQPLTEAALAAHSGPRGPTMFKLLSPAQTGIVTENRYADPKMWGEHYQELAYGAMGTGVAIGDYDGDGRPDVFVVSKTETCRLFRNLGDWKFEDVTEKAGLNKAAGVLEQDFRRPVDAFQQGKRHPVDMCDGYKFASALSRPDKSVRACEIGRNRRGRGQALKGRSHAGE